MSEILEEIDSWMEQIWLRVVKNEYEQGRILEESNLHSTVYPALRKPRLMDGDEECKNSFSPKSPALWTGCGVYFHLRKLIESSKSKITIPFIYSEMPFSTKMRGGG
jgi:hypothetical protein